MKGTYYRWTRNRDHHNLLVADILGADVEITANPGDGMIHASIPDRPLDPDTALMIGVRLVEAASLADNGRSLREP